MKTNNTHTEELKETINFCEACIAYGPEVGNQCYTFNSDHTCPCELCLVSPMCQTWCENFDEWETNKIHEKEIEKGGENE